MVPILKMSYAFRVFNFTVNLSLPSGMGKMAPNFYIGNRMVSMHAVLKCRATGLSTSLFIVKRKVQSVPEHLLTLHFDKN